MDDIAVVGMTVWYPSAWKWLTPINDCQLNYDSPVYTYDSLYIESPLALRRCSNSIPVDVIVLSDSPMLDATPYPPPNGSWDSVKTNKRYPQDQREYNIPASIVLRAPLDTDGAGCSHPDEIVVHGDFIR